MFFIIIKITFYQKIYINIGKDLIHNNILFVINMNKMNLNSIYFLYKAILNYYLYIYIIVISLLYCPNFLIIDKNFKIVLLL